MTRDSKSRLLIGIDIVDKARIARFSGSDQTQLRRVIGASAAHTVFEAHGLAGAFAAYEALVKAVAGRAQGMSLIDLGVIEPAWQATSGSMDWASQTITDAGADLGRDFSLTPPCHCRVVGIAGARASQLLRGSMTPRVAPHAVVGWGIADDFVVSLLAINADEQDD